ncbi:MAG TPA: flagellar basal body P-ring formation chaperone FlgA [Candidatus Brocadiaceae bacterium]|nr:flagellar basal body P-ring formation chaperone FlgA [Candidatus Brocadiaceae bacterium]
MKVHGILAFLVVALFAVHNVYGGKIIIELQDKVVLSEKQMVLGDIAYVSCGDPVLLERVNNIPLGNTPYVGNVRRIETAIIGARLMDEGINLNEVIYGSATASLVSVISTTVRGEDIVKKATEYLTEKTPSYGNEIVIESDRVPADKILPANDEDVRLDVSPVEGSRDRGNIQVFVRILIKDKQYLKVPVFFNVRVYENVVASSRKIGRGEILTEADLVVESIETTKLAASTFSSVDELVGKRITRLIQPYTPITPELINNPPIIKKGECIKLLLQSGNLIIVAKGVAKEDGHLGKIIKVKNTDSKKEIQGRVEDASTVKVIM